MQLLTSYANKIRNEKFINSGKEGIFLQITGGYLSSSQVLARKLKHEHIVKLGTNSLVDTIRVLTNMILLVSFLIK